MRREVQLPVWSNDPDVERAIGSRYCVQQQEAAGTLVFVRRGREQVGQYTSGDSAWSTWCGCSVFDVQSGSLLASWEQRQSPPDSIRVSAYKHRPGNVVPPRPLGIKAYASPSGQEERMVLHLPFGSGVPAVPFWCTRRLLRCQFCGRMTPHHDRLKATAAPLAFLSGSFLLWSGANVAAPLGTCLLSLGGSLLVLSVGVATRLRRFLPGDKGFRCEYYDSLTHWK